MMRAMRAKKTWAYLLAPPCASAAAYFFALARQEWSPFNDAGFVFFLVVSLLALLRSLIGWVES